VSASEIWPMVFRLALGLCVPMVVATVMTTANHDDLGQHGAEGGVVARLPDGGGGQVFVDHAPCW